MLPIIFFKSFFYGLFLHLILQLDQCSTNAVLLLDVDKDIHIFDASNANLTSFDVFRSVVDINTYTIVNRYKLQKIMPPFSEGLEVLKLLKHLIAKCCYYLEVQKYFLIHFLYTGSCKNRI